MPKKTLGEVMTVIENSGVMIRDVKKRGQAEYANNGGFDLVIIATHGRSGVSRWVWGSVADRLLRAVCIPILMVHAPGCVPGI
jgi:nucleotide-binding universal stress UspA family protein